MRHVWPDYDILGERHTRPAARPADVSERDWSILLAVRRDGRKQVDVAREYGISPTRVGQILWAVDRECLREERRNGDHGG